MHYYRKLKGSKDNQKGSRLLYTLWVESISNIRQSLKTQVNVITSDNERHFCLLLGSFTHIHACVNELVHKNSLLREH